VVAVVIVGLGALVTAQGWLAINLLRQNGRILMQLKVHPGLDPSAGPAAALPIGSRAPEFPLLDVAEQLTTGASLPDAAPVTVVVFTAPGCGPCHALLPELASWQREHAGRLGVAVISHGSADQVEAIAAEYELSGMLPDPRGATARAYRVHGTPTAVLIDAQGRIASPLTEGADAIRRLIADIVHRPLPLRR
jgi:thiol-disulfide isomerase/thioredoxin